MHDSKALYFSVSFIKKPGLRLLAPNIEAAIARGVLDLLSDCSPTEFIILYENMASLKKLLRDHV